MIKLRIMDTQFANSPLIELIPTFTLNHRQRQSQQVAHDGGDDDLQQQQRFAVDDPDRNERRLSRFPNLKTLCLYNVCLRLNGSDRDGDDDDSPSALFASLARILPSLTDLNVTLSVFNQCPVDFASTFVPFIPTTMRKLSVFAVDGNDIIACTCAERGASHPPPLLSHPSHLARFHFRLQSRCQNYNVTFACMHETFEEEVASRERRAQFICDERGVEMREARARLSPIMHSSNSEYDGSLTRAFIRRYYDDYISFDQHISHPACEHFESSKALFQTILAALMDRPDSARRVAQLLETNFTRLAPALGEELDRELVMWDDDVTSVPLFLNALNGGSDDDDTDDSSTLSMTRDAVERMRARVAARYCLLSNHRSKGAVSDLRRVSLHQMHLHQHQQRHQQQQQRQRREQRDAGPSATIGNVVRTLHLDIAPFDVAGLPWWRLDGVRCLVTSFDYVFGVIPLLEAMIRLQVMHVYHGFHPMKPPSPPVAARLRMVLASLRRLRHVRANCCSRGMKHSVVRFWNEVLPAHVGISVASDSTITAVTTAATYIMVDRHSLSSSAERRDVVIEGLFPLFSDTTAVKEGKR
jgi:hypothetical protein